jgi:hypothetical protein
MIEIAALISEVEQFPIDRETTAQERLDLDNRSRTSLFPWRGQFSPELIERLLSEYAVSGSVIADPLVGSGTTLFECAEIFDLFGGGNQPCRRADGKHRPFCQRETA